MLIALTIVCLLGLGGVAGAEELKPFILASNEVGEMAGKVKAVSDALTRNGFDIVGTYSPYKNASIIVVTNNELKKTASESEHGGYGAVQRVSVTEKDGKLQVAYTNPVYMANAYRLKGDLKGAYQALEAALGKGTPFGPAQGLSADELQKYHYMFGMEYFDDPSKLGKFDSHQEAVKAIEADLAAGKGGASKVYRVDIPGKEEVLFGVALTKECSGDEYIMSRIDFKDLRSTGHLPYEILVSEKKVFALYARFRIAINFPDLKMMGDNSFFSIMCAPGAIEGALEEVVDQG